MQSEKSPVVPAQRLIDAIRRTDRNALAEAVKAPAEEALEGVESAEAPPTDEEVRQFLEELDRSARILGQEGDRGKVMVAPDDQLTSVLQSRLAEKSIEFGKIGQDDDGVLEAQFDERDLLRWGRSLLTWIRGLRPHAWQSAARAAHCREPFL